MSQQHAVVAPAPGTGDGTDVSGPADGLVVEGLTKRFKEFTLGPVSLRVPSGSVMGFVGRNGAGKTTTVRLLLGMVAADAGTVRVLDRDARAEETTVEQDLGVVFDDVPLVESWKVRDVGVAVGRLYTRWDSGTYRGLLDRFDLPTGRKVKHLSRGMRLKLMLAVALAHDARVLVLDEPTSGLDPLARRELAGVLREHAAGGGSVLFSTHITSDLEQAADHVTVIDAGQIFYTGTTAALLDSYVLATGPGQPPDRLRSHAVGLDTDPRGFSCLLPAEHADLLPAGTVTARPSPDDVVVRVAQDRRVP
ncbi:MAG: ABC transporter ATP-binding protein [Micrococcales bacterium]|nr:ABC transporter ATP-binding protein [Micrococcales bacterium]